MNYIKINIGGKERGAKLGIGFLERVQKEENVANDEIISKVSTAALLFNALAFNCERAGEKLDFDRYEVYDWIDELGIQSNEILDFQIAFFNSFRTHLDDDQKENIDVIAKALEGKKKPQKKVGKK